MNEAADLVSYIVDRLVDDPDCYHLNKSVDENGVLLSLSIDRSQAGKVIGKDGITAMSIRRLLHTIGIKDNAKYSLKIDVWDGNE